MAAVFFCRMLRQAQHTVHRIKHNCLQSITKNGDPKIAVLVSYVLRL